jgi:hypothetical protein
MHVGVTTGNQLIAFSGEIDLATAEGFASALKPMVERGGPVTVDLSKVDRVDGDTFGPDPGVPGGHARRPASYRLDRPTDAAGSGLYHVPQRLVHRRGPRRARSSSVSLQRDDPNRVFAPRAVT